MTTAGSTSIADARTLFGTCLLGPDDVARVLDVDAKRLGADASSEVPYARAALEAARARGDVLVFRTPTDGAAPLTVLRLAERFAETIEPQLLKGVGYQLKDEWTVSQEPFAANDTCKPGWRLVHAVPVPTTCNLGYEQQDVALARYAASLGLSEALTRRSAIEAVYDTIMLARAHGTRLLGRMWDWTDTPTQDGGFVTVGEFSAGGLRIIGYSRAVRFGTLGICPQY